MPGRDGTGPKGEGSGSGRKKGLCHGYASGDCGQRQGLGHRRGAQRGSARRARVNRV